MLVFQQLLAFFKACGSINYSPKSFIVKATSSMFLSSCT